MAGWTITKVRGSGFPLVGVLWDMQLKGESDDCVNFNLESKFPEKPFEKFLDMPNLTGSGVGRGYFRLPEGLEEKSLSEIEIHGVMKKGLSFISGRWLLEFEEFLLNLSLALSDYESWLGASLR